VTAGLSLALTILRRDRWQLVLWIGGITVLMAASAVAVATEFGGERERTEIVAFAVSNPAFLFLRGIPEGNSVGALLFFQVFTFVSVLAGLMSTFLVVRNTRAEEDSGRAELVASAPLWRGAPLVAAVVVAILANLVLAVTLALAMIIVGVDATGSWLTGLATAGVGSVFATVAALTAQAMPSSRAANGAAASLLGVAFLVRGSGDALGAPSADLTTVEPSWIAWLSPIGWAQRVSPFGEASTAPLLLHVAATLLLGAVAVAIARRRDTAASLVQERPGDAVASPLRGTATGVAWALQLPALIGWTVAVAAFAALVGVLAPTLASALEDNPSLAALMESILPGAMTDAVDVFTATVFGVCGILAAAAGIQAVLRLHAEEADGRAELLLAAPHSRARWVMGHALIAAVSVVVVLAVAGLAAGLAFGLMEEGWSRLPSSVSATLAHVPAALTLVGVVAVLFAVVPRVSVGLGWGALVAAVVLGQFGELLRLPDWVQDISPFRHTPAMPLEAFEPVPALVMVAVALLAAGTAAVFIERRDIPA
jgi:ABC-2 type transport system permease protein